MSQRRYRKATTVEIMTEPGDTSDSSSDLSPLTTLDNNLAALALTSPLRDDETENEDTTHARDIYDRLISGELEPFNVPLDSLTVVLVQAVADMRQTLDALNDTKKPAAERIRTVAPTNKMPGLTAGDAHRKCIAKMLYLLEITPQLGRWFGHELDAAKRRHLNKLRNLVAMIEELDGLQWRRGRSCGTCCRRTYSWWHRSWLGSLMFCELLQVRAYGDYRR